MGKTKIKVEGSKKVSKADGFQVIPHWNDPEIGYKALLNAIKCYCSYKKYEFDRLAPVISVDEFIWDTFSNMLRRKGYPQYDSSKNRGNFYSFVACCCARNQADWARKRNTQLKNMAKCQGVDLDLNGVMTLEDNGFEAPVSLDSLIEDSEVTAIHEKIKGTTAYDYTEDLAMEEISKNLSDEQISEKFRISWKGLAQLVMKGWSTVDISKTFEIHPTTTRKYMSQLKAQMLQDENIQELLTLSGMKTDK